jgi:hypothetical protein
VCGCGRSYGVDASLVVVIMSVMLILLVLVVGGIVMMLGHISGRKRQRGPSLVLEICVVWLSVRVKGWIEGV